MKATVGVIGVGNMGSALVKGWLRTDGLDLFVWDTHQPAVKRLLEASRESMASSPGESVPAASKVAAAPSLKELVSGADTIVVVIKPKDAGELLARLRAFLRPEQTVVSAMAGLRLEWLRETLGPGPVLLRVMPNLAVELGAGAVAVAAEQGVEQSILQRSLELFGRLGLAELIPEELFDVFTAVSGSSPAFLALAVEGLEDGAVAAGLSRVDARRVVREAALKVAEKREREDDPSLARQKDHVEKEIALAFRAAVTAAMERSRQMGKT